VTLRLEAGWDQTEFGTATIVIAGTSVSVSTGKYSHRDWSSLPRVALYTDFATALNTAITGAGIGGISVSYSTTTGLYTMAVSGGPFVFTAGADEIDGAHMRMGQILGLTTSPGSSNAFSSDATPYFQINAAMGGAAQATDDYEPSSISETSEADDGSSYGISRVTAPVYSDFVAMFEPRAAVYERAADSSAPWTWEHMFRHCRVVHPFLVADDFDEQTVARFRAGSDNSTPKRVNADWRELHNIAFKTRVEGRLLGTVSATNLQTLTTLLDITTLGLDAITVL